MKKKTIAALLTFVMLTIPAVSVFSYGADPGYANPDEELLTETGEGTGLDAFLPEEADTDYSTGTPWLCSMIDGIVTADTPADPGDDFYLYVNKDKLLSIELTDERPEIGTYADVDDKVTADLESMFTGEPPQSHDARLVYDLYQLASDWETRDALGTAPLKKLTDEIEAISSIDELSDYFTEPVNSEPRIKLWRSSSTIDPTHSDRYILTVNYCLLLRNNSDEYSDPTPSGEAAADSVGELVKYLLVRTGYSEEEALQKIENCLKLEGMLASEIPGRKEREDPDFSASQNQYVTRDELDKIAGAIPVLEELETAQGFPAQEQYLFSCPNYFEKLNELYTEENLPLIRDYLIVHNAFSEAPQLDYESVYRYRHLYDAIYGDTKETDDEYTLSIASAQLNWAVARLYTERYLNQEDKE